MDDFECNVTDFGTCPNDTDMITAEPFESGRQVIKFNFKVRNKLNSQTKASEEIKYNEAGLSKCELPQPNIRCYSDSFIPGSCVPDEKICYDNKYRDGWLNNEKYGKNPKMDWAVAQSNKEPETKIIKECYELEGIFRYIFSKIMGRNGELDISMAETPNRNILSESQVNRLKNCYFNMSGREFDTMEDFQREMNRIREAESQERMQQYQMQYSDDGAEIIQIRNIQTESRAIEDELRRLRERETREPGRDNNRTLRIADLERRLGRMTEREDEERRGIEEERRRARELREQYEGFEFENNEGDQYMYYMKRDNYDKINRWIDEKYPEYNMYGNQSNWGGGWGPYNRNESIKHQNRRNIVFQNIAEKIGEERLTNSSVSQEEINNKMEELKNILRDNNNLLKGINVIKEDSILTKILINYQPNNKYNMKQQIDTIKEMMEDVILSEGREYTDEEKYNKIMNFLNNGNVNDIIDQVIAGIQIAEPSMSEDDIIEFMNTRITILNMSANVSENDSGTVAGTVACDAWGTRRFCETDPSCSWTGRSCITRGMTGGRRNVRKTNKKVSRKTNKKVSRKTNKKVSRKISKKVSRTTNKKVSRPTNKKVSRKTNKKVSRKISKKVSRTTSKKVSRKTNKKVSRKTSKKVSSKKVSKKVSRRMSRRKTAKNY